MKKVLTVLLFAISISTKAQNDVGTKKSSSLEVIVHTNKEIYSIDPDFWGTNFLYWIDDDSSLADGKIVTHLKDLKLKQLRYPGGTVADNFHWQTNTLENVNMFPYQSGAAETDFDEFMQACKKIGAAPGCVLNTETWAVKNDIQGGAHEAANWLRYCKQKGYKVKYWEIGNETYWHPILSASEYADLVNVYADSLKKIDPTIILGVNGHWNIEFVGTKERIDKQLYPELMNYRRNINNRKDYQAYQDFVKNNTQMPITKGETKWWQTVAEKCGSKIDMIIVHWYFSPGQLAQVTDRLTEVRNLFSKLYPDKKFLLHMSEYNVTVKSAESHMQLTEMVGAMLKAKTDLTAIWPMRMEYKKPTLLNVKTAQPSILFQIHKKLATDLTGKLIQTTSSDEVPSFASFSGDKVTLVLSGSKTKVSVPVKVNLKESKKNFKSCSVWRISGSEYDYKVKEETIKVNNGKAEINLTPSEVVIAVFE